MATAAVAALCIAGTAEAGTRIDSNELLTAQNKYRSELGLPPLRWSASLAQSAQQWAGELAKIDQLKHSDAPGVGENLAMWSTGQASLTKLVGIWGAEKQYFVHADFPDVSTTGNWQAVAHYSQLIWRQTKDVGCGIATGGGNDFLVCQYSPRGNIIGEKVY